MEALGFISSICVSHTNVLSILGNRGPYSVIGTDANQIQVKASTADSQGEVQERQGSGLCRCFKPVL